MVNGHEFTTWWSARQYCSSIGADFYVPNSEDENFALFTFLYGLSVLLLYVLSNYLLKLCVDKNSLDGRRKWSTTMIQ